MFPQQPAKMENNKTPSPGKQVGIERIAREKLANSVDKPADDPCTTFMPITLGQTFNGQLVAGDCTLDDDTYIDLYSFNGTAGQPISVSMSSSAFDTYLYLIDSTGILSDKMMTAAILPIRGFRLTAE